MLVALLGLVVLVVVGVSGGSSKKPLSSPRARPVAKFPAPAHLQVTIAAWQLPPPLSRTVALAVDGNIDTFGGLTAAGTTTTGSVLQIDPSTGNTQTAESLPVPVHDAAGATMASRYYLFGGGSASLTTAVQRYAPDRSQASAPLSIAGQLPAARADLVTAAAPDGTVYLAGGYDGTNFSPGVLSTRDGTSFSAVAQLPIPVRNPAAAVAAGKLWVVGGETANNAETNATQTIDLKPTLPR